MTFTLTVDSKPDEQGRVSYTITWPDDNQWRGGSGTSGQCRFGRVDDFVKRQEELGNKVVLHDQG